MTGTPAVTEPTDVAERIRSYLATRPGGEGHVENVRRADRGRSRDNWLFDLVRDGVRQPLILRADTEGGLIETDRAVEFAVLRHLEASPLPTPPARWLDETGEALGRPAMIMERLDGTCDYRVLRDPARALPDRVALARSFCELLVAVHRLDWRGCGLDTVLADPGPRPAVTELDRWSAVLHADALEPWPELEYAAVVLRERAPVTTRTTLVHADFKPGNILLTDAGVSALLDWELAHLGDPLEDLGWVTQPLRASEHTIEDAWEAPDLVARYEELTASPVDASALRWWRAFSAYKTAVMQVSGLRAFVEGRAAEPYRPTRRVLATLLDAVLEDIA